MTNDALHCRVRMIGGREGDLKVYAQRAKRLMRAASDGFAAPAARAAGSGGAHQRLADQHRVARRAARRRAQLLGARRCPTPRRRSRRPGSSSISRSVRSTSTLKSRRSRLLTPIDLGARARARARAPRRRAPRRARRGRARAPASCSAASSRGVERGDDQQHRVGAGRARLVQLVGVDDEVLAQHRQRAAARARAQVLERAAEVRPLGQHRQRDRAAALVGARRSRARRRRSRSAPAEGERRLNSAITPIPGSRQRVAQAPRAPARALRPAARGCSARAAARACAARRSARVSARIRSSTRRVARAHGVASRRRVPCARLHVALQRARGAAVGERRARRLDALGDRLGAPGGVDRGAGVDQRERLAGARARASPRRGSRA